MSNYNKLYKYLENNRCDDCNKFYPKGLEVYGNNSAPRCHICFQKLRLKPKSNKAREFYKGIFID